MHRSNAFQPAAMEALEGRRLFSLVVGLTTNDRLLTVDSDNPTVIVDSQKVYGLRSNDHLIGIDYRPATGQLFGLTERERLYTIDIKSGQATQVGGKFARGLQNDVYTGFNFNPAVDRIRIVNGADQNFRANPDTGALVDTDLVAAGIQTDGTLAYAVGDIAEGQDPYIAAAAYTNNVAGGTPTTLYAIDTGLNTLVTIGSVNGATSPNTGQLQTVGALGINARSIAGFDIVTVNGVDKAYASLQTAEDRRSVLYEIDLSTGAATRIDRIGGGHQIRAIAVVPGSQKFFALARTNRLQAYDVARPTVTLIDKKITGLAAGEVLTGIDIRPATGELFAVGESNRLYTIDQSSAVATQITATTFGVPFSAASGVGLDFNPTVDRIRLVGTNDQNFRLNPITGEVVDSDLVTAGTQVDGNLFYADSTDPAIADVAYTNNTAGASTTTLYAIDVDTDQLVTIGGGVSAVSPNTGALFAVGSLGIDAPAGGGFDILTSGATQTAYAAFASTGRSKLYSVDLTSGAATLIGNIGDAADRVIGLALKP